jgi:hypothetical protein
VVEIDIVEVNVVEVALEVVLVVVSEVAVVAIIVGVVLVSPSVVLLLSAIVVDVGSTVKTEWVVHAVVVWIDFVVSVLIEDDEDRSSPIIFPFSQCLTAIVS